MTKYLDDYEMAERHFSDPRLRLYLRQANGNRADAVRLYVWNAKLSASLLTDIGHLEVALRNAIDARMQLRHQRLKRPGDWLDDPTGELGRDRFGVGKHAQPYADIATAKRRVSENKKQLSHAQIISETPFGLWHQLVSKIGNR